MQLEEVSRQLMGRTNFFKPKKNCPLQQLLTQSLSMTLTQSEGLELAIVKNQCYSESIHDKGAP